MFDVNQLTYILYCQYRHNSKFITYYTENQSDNYSKVVVKSSTDYVRKVIHTYH